MSKKRLCLGALFIFLMILMFYMDAMRGGYIWDDDDYVTNNLNLRTFDGLRRIWLEIGSVKQYYPLVHSSFWVEYHLWQLHPFGYHLVNVLLHALNAILLWLVLRRLFIPGAWLAAVVFALHPVHVESVAWITERKNVLSGCFYLSAILAYMRFSGLDVNPFSTSSLSTKHSPTSAINRYHWGSYALALGLYLCALLSKTVACTLPATILLLLWWKRSRVGWRNVLPLIPHFVVGAALGLTTVWMEKYRVGAQGEEWVLSFGERCLVAGRALWFYTGKLFWPHKLTFIYPRWQIDTGIWWQYLFPLAAAAVFIALWLFRRQIGRGPLTAVLFFAGTLAPALGFFDVYPMRYSFVADHFQYLASIGLIVLCVSFSTTILLQLSLMQRIIGFAAYGVMILMFGMLVWQQGHIYKDVETLWHDTIAKNPECWMAHNNLGIVLYEQDKLDEGIEHYKKSLAIKPNYADTHYNLGNAYSKKGRLDEAISELKKALTIKPHYAKAHNNLGSIYKKRGRLDEAIAEHKKALAINPNLAEAHTNLGVAYIDKGMIDEAVTEHKKALAINPNLAEAHNNLGVAYVKIGRLDEAITEFNRALTINPNFAEAHNNLGFAYDNKGMLDEAISEYKKALAINPNFAEAHVNLGIDYGEKGMLEEAISEFKKALAINPNFAEAHYNLGVAYYAKENYRLAIIHCNKVVELGGSVNPKLLELLKSYR